MNIQGFWDGIVNLRFETLLILGLIVYIVSSRIWRMVRSGNLKKVKLGSLSAEFGAGPDKTDRRKNGFALSPHLECPHNRDIFQVMTKILVVIPSIMRIELRDLREEQMAFAEEKLMLVKEALMDALRALMQTKKIEAGYVSSNIVYKTYSFVITIFIGKLQDRLRAMFGGEEFRRIALDENQVDFFDYERDKAARIRAELNFYFESEFPHSGFISLEQIRAMHDGPELQQQFRDAITEIFDHGRVILMNKEREKKLLEAEMYDFIKDRIGDVPGPTKEES